jgi:ABC-type multidrug transport system fused ATPase/permease subunit
VLSDVSFTIRKGESVGLVGESGAGKTTLVDLILGLLAPTSGRVRIDGVEINPATTSWTADVGYVSQDIFLTDDSIRNNVAFGIPVDQISEPHILKSLQTAQLWDFVRALPEGLDTSVGERGVRISGGQRQRIGIARALYHEPSLLILDEATSSLDLETEKEFIETLEAVHKKVTMIVVSHRLSTLKYCDRILRIEGGRLVANPSA